jgi:hypothetical protein
VLSLHQLTRENERDRFGTVICSAMILLVAACACSMKPTERSSRKQLSKVKRNVKRFHVNGGLGFDGERLHMNVCHRVRCHPMILSRIDVTGQNK